MAHLALRPMKWGTSKGTVQLAAGAEIPETENTPFHRLDQLWRRQWITDAEGRVFGQKVAAQAPEKAETPPPPEPPQEPSDAPPDPQRWTRARLNDLGKDELKDAARVSDVPIYGTKEDIVERIMAKQRQG